MCCADGASRAPAAVYTRTWIEARDLAPFLACAVAEIVCLPLEARIGHAYGAAVTVHTVRPSSWNTTRPIPPVLLALALTVKAPPTRAL